MRFSVPLLFRQRLLTAMRIRKIDARIGERCFVFCSRVRVPSALNLSSYGPAAISRR